MRCRILLPHAGHSGKLHSRNNDGHSWYDTPNIHLCTIRDFSALCDDLGLKVQQAMSVSRAGTARELDSARAAANLRGEEAIFLLARN